MVMSSNGSTLARNNQFHDMDLEDLCADYYAAFRDMLSMTYPQFSGYFVANSTVGHDSGVHWLL